MTAPPSGLPGSISNEYFTASTFGGGRGRALSLVPADLSVALPFHIRGIGVGERCCIGKKQ